MKRLATEAFRAGLEVFPIWLIDMTPYQKGIYQPCIFR